MQLSLHTLHSHVLYHFRSVLGAPEQTVHISTPVQRVALQAVRLSYNMWVDILVVLLFRLTSFNLVGGICGFWVPSREWTVCSVHCYFTQPEDDTPCTALVLGSHHPRSDHQFSKLNRQFQTYLYVVRSEYCVHAVTGLLIFLCNSW